MDRYCVWISGKAYGYKENIYLPMNRNNQHLEKYSNIPRIDMKRHQYNFCPFCGKQLLLKKEI